MSFELYTKTMEEKLIFTPQEKEMTMALYHSVYEEIGDSLTEDDVERLRNHLT